MYFSRHIQIAIKIKPLYRTQNTRYLTSNTTRNIYDADGINVARTSELLQYGPVRVHARIPLPIAADILIPTGSRVLNVVQYVRGEAILRLIYTFTAFHAKNSPIN